MADPLRDAIRKRQREREQKREEQEKSAKIKLGTKRKPGDISKVKREPKVREERDFNQTRETEIEKRIRQDRFHRYELQKGDIERSRRMEGLPRPIYDRSASPPERRPDPMIQPQVGPIGQLRSQVAHTYGYTPEAYKELRKVPINAYPATNEFEKSRGGYYQPKDNRIYLNTDYGLLNRAPTVAHEQAHAVYEQRGLTGPAKESAYQEQFNQWEDQSTMPNGQQFDNAASLADTDLRNAMRDTDLYSRPWPTEEYARTVEFTPNDDRSNWPDEVRPYYSGFLQGMDRLQSGEPTPPIPDNLYQFQPEGPDEAGNWGAPPPNYRRWR